MQEEQRQQTLAAWTTFLGTALDTMLGHSRVAAAEEAVLELFHSTADSVRAYQSFLRENGVQAHDVTTLDDFKQLPAMSKQNYIARYPLAERCRNGRVAENDMMAASSGSTGKSTFWPRSLGDELRIAARFEQIFHDSFEADQKRTLAVVCFALGTWVGGMYTASCCRYLAAKGYPVTVVTPGSNQKEIFRVVDELGPEYEQVVLLGYPPFLKEIVDLGIARGMNWKQYQVKFVLAGEVFSEEWRALVARRVGAERPCYLVAALYGTADAGVLANETPLSVCIRRFLATHPEAARGLFKESRLPTLAQYDPLSRYLETHAGSLLLSADNGVPLIRYNILDSGGLIPYDEMLAFLSGWGFDALAELGREGSRGVRVLPFVYVFGRSDFTVSFFGANIYPENIAVGLEQPGINEWVTGKFVLEVTEDADHNRGLSVVVELAAGIVDDEERKTAIAAAIEAELVRLNSEFAHYVPVQHQHPQVMLRPLGDPEFFPAGVKHRYTRR
ncbi:MAG: phenylacetate--CoA ligase family protein [Herpetosiphon sp.]